MPRGLTLRLSEFIDDDDVLAADLRDPEFRAIWERTAVARAISLKLVAYRAEHGLSQRALAELLGMKQPQVARLECGEVTPSIPTLMRLAERLSLEIALDFRPANTESKLVNKRAQTTGMVASYESEDATVLVAAA
jgi:transcriptional regulator with XRE-family HTH domain